MPTRAQIRQAAEKLLEQAADTAGALGERAREGAAAALGYAAVTTSHVLEQAADGVRDAGVAFRSDVGEHLGQAVGNLATHAVHEVVAGVTGEPADPSSHVARQAGKRHLAYAVVKHAVVVGAEPLANLLEAGAQRLNPRDANQQEPQALPPAPSEDR